MKHRISRRGFVRSSLAAAAGSRLLPGKVDYTQHLGVELYTVRDVLPKDPERVLKEIADIGYREVEVLSDHIQRIAPILKQVHLQPVAGHYPVDLIMAGGAKWEDAVHQAKSYGLSYIVAPWLDQKDRQPDAFRAFVDKLNKAGEAAKAGGLHLCYHNHAFDFGPADGKRLIDVLMERTDRNLVGLELDIFWASVAGYDPADVLRQFSGRVPLIHLKDKAKGTPRQFNENLPASAFKEVGAGVLNIPRILQAATDAGVKHFFVEQDKTTGDPLKSLRQSYNYIKKL